MPAFQSRDYLGQSLLQSLFDDEERRPLSVAELNAQVRGEIERRFASRVNKRDGLLDRNAGILPATP